MTLTTAVLVNTVFAAALVGAWAWIMSAARHLRADRIEAEEHALVLDVSKPQNERPTVAA